MTNKEKEIHKYIVEFKTVNGFSPTLSEIAKGCYTSRTMVRQAVYSLQDKGYIRYCPEKMRSITVVKFN